MQFLYDQYSFIKVHSLRFTWCAGRVHWAPVLPGRVAQCSLLPRGLWSISPASHSRAALVWRFRPFAFRQRTGAGRKRRAETRRESQHTGQIGISTSGFHASAKYEFTSMSEWTRMLYVVTKLNVVISTYGKYLTKWVLTVNQKIKETRNRKRWLIYDDYPNCFQGPVCKN